jgi:hypothetical protein
VDRSRGEAECQALADAGAGDCDKRKYGETAHSRLADQEQDLICNRKFV